MTIRVLVCVTHLLGAGHLTRAAALSRTLAERGHRVALVSGGLPNRLIDPGGAELVQLPPVQARVGAFTRLLDEGGRDVSPGLLAERLDLLVRTALAFRPDLLVTELFPFGRRALAPEFLALLEAVRTASPGARLVSSVRDILAPPSSPAKAEATHALLRRVYDTVLAHGDERIVPLEASWPLPEDLRNRIVYTGYLDGTASTLDGEPERGRMDGVLVSGGSSAAALPLYRAALAAARLVADRPWRILVGPAVPEEDFRALASAAPGHVRIERARPDFRRLMREAAVFVGQAGYNTVMDIVATRSRAVLSPFEAGGETEQRLRAEELARRGWASLLPEAELSGEPLARLVREAAGRPRPDFGSVRQDGATRAALALEALAAGTAERSAAVA